MTVSSVYKEARSVFVSVFTKLYKIRKVQTPYYRASKILNHEGLIKMCELLLRIIQLFLGLSTLDKMLTLIFLLLVLVVLKG